MGLEGEEATRMTVLPWSGGNGGGQRQSATGTAVEGGVGPVQCSAICSGVQPLQRGAPGVKDSTEAAVWTMRISRDSKTSLFGWLCGPCALAGLCRLPPPPPSYSCASWTSWTAVKLAESARQPEGQQLSRPLPCADWLRPCDDRYAPPAGTSVLRRSTE